MRGGEPAMRNNRAVSYTHLDVYKRQRLFEEFTECIKMDLAVRLFAGL